MIYLKHRRTGRFFVRKTGDEAGREDIEWTEHIAEAHAFRTRKRAESMRRRLRAGGVHSWAVEPSPGWLAKRLSWERDRDELWKELGG